MLIIPTQPVPNQTFTAILGTQSARINVRQSAWGMFLDLYVNDALVIGGVICEDRNRIVRGPYLGFDGDLAFFDTQGTADPYYTGLGSRWQLLYLALADL